MSRRDRLIRDQFIEYFDRRIEIVGPQAAQALGAQRNSILKNLPVDTAEISKIFVEVAKEALPNEVFWKLWDKAVKKDLET